MKTQASKPVRCAIYTRVSTDHGLEQDFNSLDAQHDAAQAYIRSQAHAGWTLIRSRYAPPPDSARTTAPMAQTVN
jgi:site-specific DNA recombinase